MILIRLPAATLGKETYNSIQKLQYKSKESHCI